MKMNIEQFIKTSTKEQIISKIIELKTNPQTEDVNYYQFKNYSNNYMTEEKDDRGATFTTHIQ